MAFHQLPLELLYAILSHLGEDEDSQSLRACALTCRALVSPAQAHIFQTLTLSFEVPAVLAKLESTPHIRTFIKHLHLVEIHKPWIQHSEVLHRTLDLLSPYVTSLKIHQRRRYPQNPRFDHSELSRLTCVEEISLTEDISGPVGIICGDNAVPTFLNHFPKLQAITLDQCFVQARSEEPTKDVAAPVFQLEKLDVSRCCDAMALRWLVPALSSLQNLRISTSAVNPTFSTLLHFMITAADPLLHLEALDLSDASDADLQSLMTGLETNNTNLRSLSLTVTGFKSKRPPIQVVALCLSFIRRHIRIQHLTIGFFQHDASIDESPWHDLQDLLLGTRLPVLRSVEIRLLLNSPESIPVSTEPFLLVLPRLSEKRMIYIHHVYP